MILHVICLIMSLQLQSAIQYPIIQLTNEGLWREDLRTECVVIQLTMKCGMVQFVRHTPNYMDLCCFIPFFNLHSFLSKKISMQKFRKYSFIVVRLVGQMGVDKHTKKCIRKPDARNLDTNKTMSPEW